MSNLLMTLTASFFLGTEFLSWDWVEITRLTCTRVQH